MTATYRLADQYFSFRSSKRLTITVPQTILEALIEISHREGRSLSNLAAYLLESSLQQRMR